ncbi:alpha/beta hydrolase [Ponticaulis sp.]|uniref:alpha/beta fold hydrolase n=1 Tax=Ponticaulis sp. TaxID=2020902 RepID=UPI0025CCF332|nr:alpha/beta hydrolase [Ponticaulis sp.]
MDITYSSADGLNLYAKSYGPEDAPITALCMHGLTRNHKDFEPMIEALLKLRSDVRFIAVDVRGRALSDKDPNPENYTPLVYAQDMVALLDHLGLEKVFLIGTSMGGLMSMILMTMIPQRVHGVVLNDIGPVLMKKGLDRIQSYVGGTTIKDSWEEAANAVASVQKVAFPDYTDEQWMAFAKRTYRELEDGRVELDYDPEISRSVKEVRPNIFTNMAMWKLFRAMKPVPMLLVRGELSDLLSPKNANKMVRKHGNAKLVTVARVGHTPLLDEPTVVEALNEFLSQETK